MAGIMRVPTPSSNVHFTLTSKSSDYTEGCLIVAIGINNSDTMVAIYRDGGWIINTSGELTCNAIGVDVGQEIITYTFTLYPGKTSQIFKATFLPPPFDKSTVNWVSPTEGQVA